MTTDGNRQEAADLLSHRLGELVQATELSFYSWPKVFDSTNGPFGQGGGQQVTTFQMTAYLYGSTAVIFVGGRFWRIRSNFKFDDYL
jgi:hypothetical protein